MNHKIITASLTLVLLVVMTACGGGSKSSTPATSSSTTIGTGTSGSTGTGTTGSTGTGTTGSTGTGTTGSTGTGTGTTGSTGTGTTGSTGTGTTTPTLVSITVSPSIVSLAPGESQQFVAAAIYSDSTSTDITSSVTWSSAAASVASINTAGTANALSTGSSLIQAQWNGMGASATLTVNAAKASLVSISVTPNTSSVTSGTPVQLHASGSYSDGSSADLTDSVTWSSANSSVSTVNSNGLASTLAAGVAVISAASGSVTGAATITVNSTSPSIVNVSLAANPSMDIGGTQQLTAMATLSDGSSQDVTSRVTWSSSNLSIGTVDTNGKVAAISSGSLKITATLPEGISGATNIVVNTASLSALTISPDGLNVPIGVTQQFTASGDFTDGTTQDLSGTVAWATSDPTLATVDASGVVKTLAAGMVTITATSGGQSDTATLTIVPAKLTSIVVTPANTHLSASTSVQFSATGVFDDGSTQPLSNAVWSSSAAGVAVVNGNGLVTAVASGTATISASVGSVNGSTNVTVTAATLVSLMISPSNPTASVSTTTQFAATGQFSDGSSQDLTSQVIWSSSAGSIATINSNGLASSLSPGTTTINAKYGSVSASTQLTVSTANLVSLAIVPANPVMAAHTRMQLSVIGTYSDGSTSTNIAGVSWKSSKNKFATARPSGVVFAKRTGSATITASASGIKATTTVTISNGTVTSIAITPANPSVAKGNTQQFTAMGSLSDGAFVDLTYVGHWASSSPAVALIGNAPGQPGLATAVGVGNTTISVSANGVTGSTALTVQ